MDTSSTTFVNFCDMQTDSQPNEVAGNLQTPSLPNKELVIAKQALLPLQNVDDLLRSSIEYQTKQDSNFWSLSDQEANDNLHGLFQYPAMMVPKVLRWLIQTILKTQPNISSVMDPYVGAGTSLVSTMHQGLNCYGQDINPLAVLLTRTRTGPEYRTDLTTRLKDIMYRVQHDLSDQLEADFPNLDKWFQPKVAVELSKLRRAIRDENELWVRRFLWITLAETVRITSNDRTSTYKLHMRPVEEIEARDISPISTFALIAAENIKRLELFTTSLEKSGYLEQQKYIGKVQVVLQSSLIGVMPEPDRQLYDLLITSPPYGDNLSTVPYGQHSYLPLQWIDFVDIDPLANPSCLRTTQEIDRQSIGGKTKIPKEEIEQLSELSESLSDIFKQLKSEPVDRTMRVASFYQDFFVSLDHIVDVMRDNAYMVWIVGNRTVGGITIPNDQILSDYLHTKHVKRVTYIDRVIHKKRMPKRNRTAPTMAKERILIFRKCYRGERA